MASIQMTAEQLQQLIESIRGASVAAVPQQQKRSIGNCTVTFGGQRDHHAVEEFITSVQTFKDIENISDEDALKGISLLFYGLASTWWQGVKKEAKTWEQAIELIRSHFSPKKLPYQLYLEIFESKQSEGTAIDAFICEKRALLAQLPDERHDEETQLDFVYGLLHIKYRKRIPRDEVRSFKDLLDKGRLMEQTQTETGDSSSSSRKPVGKPRCTHCNYRGHTYENCKKRKAEEDDD